MKLKEIKNTQAIDITNTISELSETLSVVAVSRGVYGMNGALLQGDTTGKLYKITARNTNLFRYV
jgi:hypothetical protein